MNANNSNDKVKEFLPDLLNDFSIFIPKDSKTKIINYSGLEGLKKVTMNSLNAKDELFIFEIETMDSFLDFGFCEDVRKEFVENKIYVRELTNQKNLKPWTNIEEFVTKYWKCKYIDDEILKLDTEILIYNDVVTFYNYKNNDIFCVEIYNQNLANMQKQIFNFMWHYGKPLKIGKGGSTSL